MQWWNVLVVERYEGGGMNDTKALPVAHAFPSGVKVYYPDDPDPEKAGQGLAAAPFIEHAIGRSELAYWMMSPAEQTSFTFLLQQLRPEVAIEIGTRFGGSLQILSRYCEKVYSLDIDPDVPKRLEGRFPNVEYMIGPSEQTLPPLIEQLNQSGKKLSFAFVDGDHSAEGVRTDINNLLRYVPRHSMFIVMHDSFNPECRRGLRSAEWATNPHVHAVELDFVPGVVNPSPKIRGQLWGGLALACLMPDPRSSHFEVTGGAEMTFQLASMAWNGQTRASLPRRILRSVNQFFRPNHPRIAAD